jgi:peptidyl-prolyl cis-trans isomerase C
MAEIAAMLDRHADHVAVHIDDIPITQGDAAEYVRSMPVSMASLGFEGVFRQAMEALIRQKMMVVNAKKEGLDKNPAVIRSGQIMAEKVLADAWLAQKANEAVTDKALHARYDRFVAGKPGPDEVQARAILVPTQAEARKLIAKLQEGAEFADLARQYSKDPSAVQGGDLGFQMLDALSPELGSVMFSLSPGQMTAFPVSVPNGYFILRVEGRRQRAPLSFEEARPLLERAERAEAVRAAVLKLSDEVNIVKPPAPTPGDDASKR